MCQDHRPYYLTLPRGTCYGPTTERFACLLKFVLKVLSSLMQTHFLMVILAYSALDSLANEMLPSGYVYTEEGSQKLNQEHIEGHIGLELRLSKILSAATGIPNLRQADPLLWGKVLNLKNLRDDVGHAKSKQAVSVADPDSTIFARLYNDELLTHIDTVKKTQAHYGGI